MASDFRMGEETSFIPRCELRRWQKIQDLFAKILRINISFLDLSGAQLTKPSFATSICSELALPLRPLTKNSPTCLQESFHRNGEGKSSYFCIHHLHYFSLKVQIHEKISGVVILGPTLVGKREEEQVYRDRCRDLEVDEENFLDLLREIKLVTHADISLILEFFEEMSLFFTDLLSQEPVLEDPLAHDFTAGKKDVELANSLLELALRIVNGSSGSVLLFDDEKQSFQIKTTRGIASERIPNQRLPLKGSIAGLVADRGVPMLIQKETNDDILTRRLQRHHEIQSSIIIPMKCQDDVLGVLCLNSESENDKFNQENLVLLDQLGQLAGVGFRRSNAL